MTDGPPLGLSKPRLLDHQTIFIFALQEEAGDPFAAPAPPSFSPLDLAGVVEPTQAAAVFHRHAYRFLQENVRILQLEGGQELTVVGPGFAARGRILWSRLNLIRQAPFLGGPAGGLRLCSVATALESPTNWEEVLLWNAVLRERQPKEYQQGTLGSYRVQIAGREYPGRLPQFLEEILTGTVRAGAATGLSYVLGQRSTFPDAESGGRDFIVSDAVNAYFDPFRKFRPFLTGGDVLPISDSLTEYHYREWASSTYAFSTYGLSVLAFDNSHDGEPVEANLRYMKEWLANPYYLSAILALFHRETLLRVSEELARMGTSERIPERVRQIREFMLAFTNQTWFNEITGDIQAQGIWEGWRRGLGTNRLYQEVKEELQELDQFLQDRYNALLNRSILRLTRYSIPLAFFGALVLTGQVLLGWLGLPSREALRLAWILSALVSILLFVWLGFSAEGYSPLAVRRRSDEGRPPGVPGSGE